MPFFGGGGAGDYHIIGTNIKGGVNATPAVIGDNNMALGNGAGQLMLNADGNILIGNGAGSDIVDGASNVFVGYNAGVGTGQTPLANVAVGQDAFLNGPADLRGSVGIGYRVGADTTGSEDLVFMGREVGIGSNGNQNVFVGSTAGNAVSGSDVVAVGNRAGYHQSDDELTDLDVAGAVLLGSSAGAANYPDNAALTRTLTDSVFIGKLAGYQSAPTENSQIATEAVVVGANSGRNLHSTDDMDMSQSIVVGANSGCFDNAMPSGVLTNNIVIGNGINPTQSDSIVIGNNTHTSVLIGGINLLDISDGFFPQIFAENYVAVGVDSNSAQVNGVMTTALHALWVDDGGADHIAAGFGKAASGAASGSTQFLGRSRGTLVAPTIVQNGDMLGSIVAAGHDGTDFATSSRIDFEVDGAPGNNAMPGRIVFHTAPLGSQAMAEVARITHNKFLRMAAGSGGIQFGGDTAAVNALNDYEEGTFTPTLIGRTVPGTQTYSRQLGRYVKIGKSVTLHGWVTISAADPLLAGDVVIGGLPFAIIAGDYASAASLNWTFVTNKYSCTGFLVNSRNFIQLQAIAVAAQSPAALALADINGIASIQFSITYTTQ